MTAREAARRVTIRKYQGDDAYSYALFIDGRPTYNGMSRSEATWRRKSAIANLIDGKDWNHV